MAERPVQQLARRLDRRGRGLPDGDRARTASPRTGQPARRRTSLPTASFTVDADEPGGDVRRLGSTDTDGTVASYAWDFGDGTTGTGSRPRAHLRQRRQYQVKLTVTDDQGADGLGHEAGHGDRAPANQPPTAAFTSRRRTCWLRSTLRLDGPRRHGRRRTPGTSVTARPAPAAARRTPTARRHVPGEADGHRRQGRDRHGDQAGHRDRATVNQPPTASFTSAPSNLQVAFDGSASADGDGTVTSYAWDFGDATTGTGKTRAHVRAG